MLKNDVKVRGLMGFALKGLCLLALNFGQCAVSKEVRNREALHHLDLRPWESSSWCDMSCFGSGDDAYGAGPDGCLLE